MPGEMEVVKRDLAELGRRVEKLETRGSDTAVESLRQVRSISEALETVHEKLDGISEKLDDVRSNGCMKAPFHESRVEDALETGKTAISMAIQLKEAVGKMSTQWALLTVVGTSLLVGLINILVALGLRHFGELVIK